MREGKKKEKRKGKKESEEIMRDVTILFPSLSIFWFNAYVY